MLATRAVAMPRDTNPHGDIFGGWIMSQMDQAGASVATVAAQGRVVTVSVDSLSFLQPVFIGDEVACFAEIIRVGRTSLTINIEAWVQRALSQESLKVTEGTFTFVAIDDNYRPREVQRSKNDHGKKS